MVFPAVNLHTFHSLNLYDGLDIIFDLTLLDVDTLKWTEDFCVITLIPNMFTINASCISIQGYKLSDSTFMVNSNGDLITIPYSCSTNTIKTGIEYLQQMYKNMTTKCEEHIDTKWNPKPYKPEELI
jgi:hypothetical protein